MEDDEVSLKAKLDQTDDIEERRDLRKQIREIRNKKFEEELKKISGGEKSSSSLVNDLSSRAKPTRVPTINQDEDGSDPYGLLQYTDEASLQELLNETPFTETDKRRKIRARMREVRNAEFDKGLTSTAATTRGSTREKRSSSSTNDTPSKPPTRTVREPSPEPAREPSPGPSEPSPEPVREPSPDPIREPSPEPVKEPSPEPLHRLSPEPVREPSPQVENKYSRHNRHQSFDESGGEEDKSKMRNMSSDEESEESYGSDSQENFRTSEDSQAVLNLERPCSQSGEQHDFRDLLKKKSEKPVNLERQLTEPEQVDFRVALERKVEMPPKDSEPASGEQVDFRHALKKKVDKPVFDKSPAPAAQVDFRNQLRRSVKTKTLEDKESTAEQKDFRVVLGNKAPPSPTTGRRYRGPISQESVDRCDSPETVEVDKMEPVAENSAHVSVAQEREPAVVPNKKTPPPPPVKKKAPLPKPKSVEQDSIQTEETEAIVTGHECVNEVRATNDSLTEVTRPAESEDVEEVDGIVRNKQVARAERNQRRHEKSNEDNKETIPHPSHRRAKKLENTITDSRSQKQEIDTEKAEPRSKKTLDKEDIGNATPPLNGCTSFSDSVQPVNGMKGSDHESTNQVTPRDDDAIMESASNSETNGTLSGTVDDSDSGKVNGHGQGATENLGSGKAEANNGEKIEVSSDLLDAINQPKEDNSTPKKSIDSQLKKNKLATTPLTGRAAERERERLKREEEREARAAARAKERDEAARKRKEQKEAFEKKMAEQKRTRELKQRGIGGSSPSARASRNAFKEKLESNSSPRSESPARNITVANSNLTKLLGWARKRTREYQGVSVENFSESWSDGLAFAALIHSFCPDLIPINELTKETRRRNFELAFTVAKNKGVMDLLEVDDMVNMRSPDPKSIMTYVHSVYQTFMQQDTSTTSA